MSESNLPPEQWRPYFEKIGVEFGYRPLAARVGMNHNRLRRVLRGSGTSDDALRQVADAFGVSVATVHELRGEPAVEVDPFILPDDAGRLNDTERDVVRRMVRALLDARERTDDRPADQPARHDPPAKATRAQGTEVEKSNVRDLMRRGSSPATEPEELPEDAWAARTRDPRFKPDIPEDDGIGEESQDDE